MAPIPIPGITTRASIDLPRPLLDYFAFAETAPTREGRRFSITLPYLRADGRIDRLQWWYHLAEGKEKVLGEEALRSVRAEAIERFSTHIERWLHNTTQTLRGEGPIPQLSAPGTPDASMPTPAPLPERRDAPTTAALSESASPVAAGVDGEAAAQQPPGAPVTLPPGRTAFG